VLDAKLVGMKRPTPDQEKLWPPFESAVRDADKGRLDAIEKRVVANEADEKLSPVDRLDAFAQRLSDAASSVKKISDAAKLLYASLDTTQKHEFAALGRMLMPERSRFAMEMMRHGWRERE
jgi:hypothetical protein